MKEMAPKKLGSVSHYLPEHWRISPELSVENQAEDRGNGQRRWITNLIYSAQSLRISRTKQDAWSKLFLNHFSFFSAPVSVAFSGSCDQAWY